MALENTPSGADSRIAVTMLTGGGDRPYVFGLTTALSARNAILDVIGSDELDFPEFHTSPGVNFLNLRGDQRTDVPFRKKVRRVAVYYGRLLRYAWRAKPRVFHILWNNKIEFFDRTVLMLYYKCLGKKIVLTAHNINAGRRDGNDTAVNRFTLRVQYRLADHVFVHTEQMKQELMRDLGVREERITVIPFGINNAVPNTELLPSEARRRLGIGEREKTILFFGRITPYKGLEYLAEAFRQISRRGDYRLIIAGRPKECAQYWEAVQNSLAAEIRDGRVLVFPEFIPDEDTEIYFKAADLFVLPYRHIYQSGVLFLGQSFGLPVIVSDVGSLKDDVIEGETGYVIRPEHADELGKTIERYFAGDLYRNVNRRRQAIRDYTAKKHSWEDVSQITMRTYAGLLQMPYPNLPQAVSPSSANAKTSS